MDIKLKNKNLKVISFVLSIFLITISLSALLGFHINRADRNYLTFKSYFESDQFGSGINDFFNRFMNYNITHKDYTSKSVDEKISLEEVDRLKKDNDRELQYKIDDIERQYNSNIDEAERNGNKDRLNRLIEERNKKLEEVKKTNTKTIDDIKNELTAKSDMDYKNLKKEFEGITDIKYYIINTKSNEVYTNLSDPSKLEEYIKNNSIYSLSFPNNSYKNPFIQTVNSRFAELSLEGYIVIPQGGYHVYNYNEYNKYKTIALIQLFAIFICSAAGIYLLKYSKKNSIDEHMIIIGAKALYNKIPFDIRTLVLVFALLIAPEIYGDKSIFPRLDSEFLLVLALVTAFTFYFYISIPEAIRSLKDKEEFKNQFESGVVYRFKEAAIRGLREKNILFKCIIYVTAFGLLSTITAVILEHDGLAAVVFILIYVFLSFLFISRKISMLDKIIKGTNEITKGNLNYVIKEKGKGNLSRLAHNINNMKSGISKAVESQMKSDRLKSELITNVSHDLKTPLTSIINYVDLLKKEDLSKDELQGYISVLDRKTQRLKVLIEDLFEASKMASGAVELNIEKVDVAQLLNQSLAELDEKIRHSNLAFRVNIPHHKVYAELDGKKTWRVFENLIGNILKYSQPNTRVYIDLTETDDKVLIIMKNISSYEMEFDVEEIFERFKRGDTSRATEGSGLGLAIAKSIVDIQGGSLTIDIDGDLFKSTVEFNK